MRKHRRAESWLFVVTCLVATPGVALAQSAIGGLVTDTTGGVLPGVTVEAASPALIEGSRVAVTDAQGRYLIIELRPGQYRVTFTLPGFATVVREGVALPADFTATVNAQMRVGSIEESVTVTGASPVVDVQRTQRQQVIGREIADVVPTGHTNSALGALVPGIRTSALEVGSSRAMQASYMSVYGAQDDENTITIDGIVSQAVGCNGVCFGYMNEQQVQETTFDTAGASAEYSRGGVRSNMIPKDGANTFSGLAYVGGSHKRWQSSNLTQRLKDLGLRSVDRVERIFDVNLTQGGPLLRDRLWFFGGYRRWATDQPVAGLFYRLPDGTPDYSRPGIDDNMMDDTLLRLTWQVSPRNKLVGHFDKQFKERFHEEVVAGDDIETASRHRTYPIYYVSNAKWTSTPSTRMLVELGYGGKVTSRIHDYQTGIRKAPFTREWYATASHVDRDLVTRWVAAPGVSAHWDKRFVYLAKLSYVTGSHAFKAGFQTDLGPEKNGQIRNADLYQEYRTGVPDTVLLANTPTFSEEHLDGDNGLFVQDSWTLDRLTLNSGVRFEWLNGSIRPTEIAAGRFVPVRRFPERKDLPDWFDVSPRLGLSYDLFGTGKTAIKFTLNRYMEGQTVAFASRYSPMRLATQRVPWNDRNGDDIAQEGEFNVSLLPTNFGERALSRPDPDIERTWNLLSTVGIDHELLPGFSVSGAWIRRSFYDLTQSNNVLWSLADYTPVTIVNPLNGLPITVHNLRSQALLARVDIFDTNANTELPASHPYAGLERSEVYNALELSFSGRLRGATVFGGWTAERTITVDCDSLDDPNTFRFCNRSGLDAESGIDRDLPFRHMFKASGSYSLPYGLRFSAAFRSFDGAADPVNWVVSRNTTYPSSGILARAGAPGCVGCADRVGQRVIPQLNQSSVTVRLETPGERYLERQNLLDFSFIKQVNVARLGVELQVDIFNVLNNDTVLNRRTNLAANYGQPTSVMLGRLLQLATRLRW